MAQFYETGLDGFEAARFAQPHPNTIAYVQNHLNLSQQYVNPQNESFLNRSFAMFDQYYGADTLQRMRTLSNVIGGTWQDDQRIGWVKTVDDLQIAPLAMQRWLMAEPITRQMYHDRRIDGYSEDYVDPEPGLVGEAQYDYRRVMNGIVQEADDGSLYTVEWVEDLMEGDPELLADEQFDIIRSWETLALNMLSGADDPTSVWGGEVG